MAFNFVCPDCGKKLKLKDQAAGKKIRCPECSSLISVASRSARGADDDVDDSEGDEETPVRRKRSKSRPAGMSNSTKQAIALAVKSLVGLAVVAGVGVGLYFGVTALMSVVSGTTADLPNGWKLFKHPSGVVQIELPGAPHYSAANSLIDGTSTYTYADKGKEWELSVGVRSLSSAQKDAVAKGPDEIDKVLQAVRAEIEPKYGSAVSGVRRILTGEKRGIEFEFFAVEEAHPHDGWLRYYVFPTGLVKVHYAKLKPVMGAEADWQHFFNSIRDGEGNFLLRGELPPVLQTPAPDPTVPQPGWPGQTAPSGMPPQRASAQAASTTLPLPPALPGQPTPPIKVPAPPPPAATLAGNDLKQIHPADLANRAAMAAAEAKFAEAIQLQYWSVQNAGTGAGQLELANYYVSALQKDAAIYWLQRAALEDGVDPADLSMNLSPNQVTGSTEWQQVRGFVRDCSQFWMQSQGSDTQLILPQGVGPDRAVPVMICLHHDSGSPRDLVNVERCQKWADAKSIAFLGVCGNVRLGPSKFRWTNDPALITARIDAALAEVQGRLKPVKECLILCGFTTGGSAALQAKMADPDRFLGAVYLSPAFNEEFKTKKFAKSTHPRSHRTQIVSYANPLSEAASADLYLKASQQETGNMRRLVLEGTMNPRVPPTFDAMDPDVIDYATGRH